MYQITAVYQDCEIAYAEGEEYGETLWDCREQVLNSIYNEVIDEIEFIVV